MFKIKTATRLAITFGLITASLIWSAMALEVIPNPTRIQVKRRVDVTRSIALGVTAYAENRRALDLNKLLTRTVDLDRNVESVGVKLRNRNDYLTTAGPHQRIWQPELGNDPSRQLSVQVLTNGREWGELEIVFVPLRQHSWLGYPFGMIAFIASARRISVAAISMSFSRHPIPW